MDIEAVMGVWGMIGWLLAAFFWLKSERTPKPRNHLPEGKGYQPKPTTDLPGVPLDEPNGPKPLPRPSGLKGQLVREDNGASRPLITNRQKPERLSGQLRKESDTTPGKIKMIEKLKEDNEPSKD